MFPVTSPSSSRPFSPVRLSRERGFSLIEVVIAVGIVAFAFVAILGLFPAGMGQFRQAIDTSVTAQIAQRIIAEAQQMEFVDLIDEKNLPTSEDFAFRAPTVNSAAAKCVRYYDEQGMELVPANTTTNVFDTATEKEPLSRLTYMVNVRVMPKTIVPSTASTHIYHLATLTIQVAYNPGNLPINLSNAIMTSTDPKRGLWTKTPGVSVIGYCAQIGRN